MIVATSGHVDHGKTLLIKALTGVDTDRLPEEKRRGMTIDLGFAYLPAAAGEARGTLGFIDVPGHERFIHNMLCGVAGIDAVLLVVAADDGPMPQTREHLAILDLLEVRRGMVALTKIDRAAPERVAEVRAQLERLLAGTALAGSPVFPLSALTGEGVAALKQHLERGAASIPARPAQGNFRLAVDRSFIVAGAGTVVTGTAFSGRIEADAPVRALHAGFAVRVRGIHAQNAAARAGQAGQRCALNLAGPGVSAGSFQRGEWIVAGELPPPARKIDVRLRLLASERALRHWTPVHVHLASSDVTGRVALLEGDVLAPGESGLAQLVLDRPIGAVHGDRFVIRDQSAQRTLGGGRVIDVFAPPRGRARPARLAWLRAMEQDDALAALDGLLALADAGLDLARFARNRNLAPAEADALHARTDMKRVTAGGMPLGFVPARWAALRESALRGLAALHARTPESAGPAPEKILEGSGERLPPQVQTAVAAELLAEGVLRRNVSGVRLASHRSGFAGEQAALWQRVVAVISAEPARPPLVAEIVQRSGLPHKAVLALLGRAVRMGLAARVSETRFFLPSELLRFAQIAEGVAAASADARLTAAAFRDRSGLGRNLSIEVLEFFDRVRFTRRVGDARVLLRPAAEVFADNADADQVRPDPAEDKDDQGRESHPGGARTSNP